MKKWYQSKTILFNLIVAVLAAAEAAFPSIQNILPVNVYALISFVLTVGNVGLRFITAQTVVDRRKQDEAVNIERRA